MTLLRSRRRGGYPGRTALLRDLPSQIDAAVRVELSRPKVKLLRNIVGAKSSVIMAYAVAVEEPSPRLS